jgi:hypothetical protein
MNVKRTSRYGGSIVEKGRGIYIIYGLGGGNWGIFEKTCCNSIATCWLRAGKKCVKNS